MIREQDIQQILGGTAYGSDGEKLGKIGQVYLDDQTGRPEWATINTGLFGTSETFVPLAEATASGDGLRLPYSKDRIKDAPNVSSDAGHLSQSEEAELYRYYGLSYGESGSDSGLPEGSGHSTGQQDSSAMSTGMSTGMTSGMTSGTSTGMTSGTTGHDTSGRTTDDAMTRSEERLRVGTEQVEAGRARLRKYVTTENVTQSVPVTRETARIEREPITDANIGQAMDGPALSEEEHEVTLHQERPIVEKEAVPVERVRLAKETVTEQETVSEDVRKEQITEDGGIDLTRNETRSDLNR